MPHPKFATRPHDYGLKRFSFEYWVGSHPRLKPCNVFPDCVYTYGFWGIGNGNDSKSNSDSDSNWMSKLQQVPWISLDGFWHWSFTEWMCSMFHLSQYKFLYGMYPDTDSYIWIYYDTPLKVSFKNLYQSFFDWGCVVSRAD